MNAFCKFVAFYLLTSTFAIAEIDFKKVGEARMEYLFWDVYDATLFTPSGSYTLGENPIRFKLTYLRDFDAKDIVKATKEQWQHLGKAALSEKYTDRLLTMWPNIKEGESLTLATNDQGHSIFYHNDNQVGEINDTQFATHFLAIWLSIETSEPALRKQLLGN